MRNMNQKNGPMKWTHKMTLKNGSPKRTLATSMIQTIMNKKKDDEDIYSNEDYI